MKTFLEPLCEMPIGPPAFREGDGQSPGRGPPRPPSVTRSLVIRGRPALPDAAGSGPPDPASSGRAGRPLQWSEHVRRVYNPGVTRRGLGVIIELGTGDC
jgi:hypothetical protein